MKKFINRPETVVEDMLEGVAVLSPGLRRLSGHNVMVRADAEHGRDRRVALFCGRGSGPKPAHSGHLGAGQVAAIGRAAVESLATMGVSFSAGTSPSVGKPSFELGDNEMELGLGIHGEPGVARVPLKSANELTEILLTEIMKHGKFGAER